MNCVGFFFVPIELDSICLLLGLPDGHILLTFVARKIHLCCFWIKSWTKWFQQKVAQSYNVVYANWISPNTCFSPQLDTIYKVWDQYLQHIRSVQLCSISQDFPKLTPVSVPPLQQSQFSCKIAMCLNIYLIWLFSVKEDGEGWSWLKSPPFFFLFLLLSTQSDMSEPFYSVLYMKECYILTDIFTWKGTYFPRYQGSWPHWSARWMPWHAWHLVDKHKAFEELLGWSCL